MTLVFLFYSGILAAQCGPDYSGDSFYSQPSFVTLYNSGQCHEDDFSSGSIFVKYARISNSTQLARFSYASDEGNFASLIQVNQYDMNCILIAENLNTIWQGSDSVIVEYVISSESFQVFCPYTIASGVLAAHFGNIECGHQNGILAVRWNTLSNSNTNKFDIQVSSDAVTWENLIEQSPENISSSSESNYFRHIPFDRSGTWYTRIREEDFNGSFTYSDICSFTIRHETVILNRYDLSGRAVSSQGLFYISK